MPPVTNEPILTVRGSAQLFANPDLATIWWSVRAETKDAATAEAALAKRFAMADAVLEEMSAAIQKTERHLNISPRIQYRRGQSTTSGYLGEGSIKVELSDFELLAELVGNLLKIPDAAITGPQWSLQPDHPAFTEVRLAAIRDAQRIAHDYAAAFGVIPNALLEVIDDAGFQVAPRFAMRAAASSVEDLEINFQPEAQEVSASVTVRFRIDNPDQETLRGPG